MLIPIDGQTVSAAGDFAADQQLAAQRVEPGLVVGRTQQERRVLLEVGVQADAEAQIIGAPALFYRQDAQDIAVALGDQCIVDACTSRRHRHAACPG